MIVAIGTTYYIIKKFGKRYMSYKYSKNSWFNILAQNVMTDLLKLYKTNIKSSKIFDKEIRTIMHVVISLYHFS